MACTACDSREPPLELLLGGNAGQVTGVVEYKRVALLRKSPKDRRPRCGILVRAARRGPQDRPEGVVKQGVVEANRVAPLVPSVAKDPQRNLEVPHHCTGPR